VPQDEILESLYEPAYSRRSARLRAGLLLGIHPPPVFGRLAVPYYEAHRAMIKQRVPRAGAFCLEFHPSS
jgi:hypothetical protein